MERERSIKQSIIFLFDSISFFFLNNPLSHKKDFPTYYLFHDFSSTPEQRGAVKSQKMKASRKRGDEEEEEEEAGSREDPVTLWWK